MPMRSDVTIIPFGGRSPRIHESAFIAPGCRIIGDVEIGADASIWYNCVIRGDVNRIVIGARSNIQDGCVIHCDSPDPSPAPSPAPSPDSRHRDGFPTLIGEDVLVGHMVMLHGCTIHDRGFIGLSATVMNGCVIESDSMLAAGALLTPGKRVAARQMWGGRPAGHMRDLTDAALAQMQLGVAHYVANARAHRAVQIGGPD